MKHLTKFDSRAFRLAVGRFASGVTVVTTEDNNQVHGMTANSFTSVSLEPPLVLISLGNNSRMHELLPKTGKFGISVLRESQVELSNHFAGKRDPNLLVPFESFHGVPVIGGALSRISCTVANAHREGDHTLYIGRVTGIEYEEGPPLIFYSGGYNSLQVA